MERDVVVIAFARQLLDPFGVPRREIGPQLEDDAALGGVDNDRILLVETSWKRLCDRGGDADQCGENGKNSDRRDFEERGES